MMMALCMRANVLLLLYHVEVRSMLEEVAIGKDVRVQQLPSRWRSYAPSP